MTLGVLVLLAIFAVGHFLITDRNHRRATNAHQSTIGAHREEFKAMVEGLKKERKEHLEQVQYLLQRIQAPEVAVIQHQVETAGEAGMQVPLNDAESARREEWEHLHREIAEMEAAEAAA